MRTLLCVIGLVLSASPGHPVAGQDSPLDEADRRAFAWFDGLGLPSCAGRPLVRLTMTKEEPREGEGPGSAEGFLVAETPDSFTLVGDDLWPRVFPRRRTGVRVTSEPLDRVPRQEPLADLDRRFDCGRRPGDAGDEAGARAR